MHSSRRSAIFAIISAVLTAAAMFSAFKYFDVFYANGCRSVSTYSYPADGAVVVRTSGNCPKKTVITL